MNRPSSAESRRTSRAIVSVIEQSPAIAGDRAESSPLSCEHEVLSAEGERREQALGWPERTQQMREDEEKVRAHDLETRASKEASRLGRHGGRGSYAEGHDHGHGRGKDDGTHGHAPQKVRQ